MKTRVRRGEREAAAMLKGQPWFDRFDWRSNVVDALCALFHFCDRRGISFDDALEMAKNHVKTERKLDARNADPAEDGGEG